MKNETVAKNLAAYLVAAACPGPVQAAGADRSETCLEHFSGETVRWIVSCRTGGGYDTYARLMEPSLEDGLDAQVC